MKLTIDIDQLDTAALETLVRQAVATMIRRGATALARETIASELEDLKLHHQHQTASRHP